MKFANITEWKKRGILVRCRTDSGELLYALDEALGEIPSDVMQEFPRFSVFTAYDVPNAWHIDGTDLVFDMDTVTESPRWHLKVIVVLALAAIYQPEGSSEVEAGVPDIVATLAWWGVGEELVGLRDDEFFLPVDGDENP